MTENDRSQNDQSTKIQRSKKWRKRSRRVTFETWGSLWLLTLKWSEVFEFSYVLCIQNEERGWLSCSGRHVPKPYHPYWVYRAYEVWQRSYKQWRSPESNFSLSRSFNVIGSLRSNYSRESFSYKIKEVISKEKVQRSILRKEVL